MRRGFWLVIPAKSSTTAELVNPESSDSALGDSSAELPRISAGNFLTPGILPSAATRPAALFAPLLRRSAGAKKLPRNTFSCVEAMFAACPSLAMQRAAQILYALDVVATEVYCLDASQTSSTPVLLDRLISHATPRKSEIPTSARLKLLYFDCPAPRGRWLTGTLRTSQPARCISAGR